MKNFLRHLLLFALLLLTVALGGPTAAAPSLNCLIVGGGPDKDDNQYAIESNVLYVTRILPTGTHVRTLFADGDPASKDVLALNPGSDSDYDSDTHYERATISNWQGSSTLPAIKREMGYLAQAPQAPTLLYFTGHGGENEAKDTTNNYYCLWDDDDFYVRQLGRMVAKLPPSQPIAVVMAQCYSGSFGNLVFQDGNPKNPPTDLDICGFFASIETRMAAGCTPEVNQADYRDFTSYFFAALSGENRLGHKTTGADYGGTGTVTMTDAFAYALIHDESIDTPDIFLRHYVTVPDRTVFRTLYSQVLVWVTPAQRVALEQISARLKATGDDRLWRLYRRMEWISNDSEDMDDVYTIRIVRLAKSVVLAHDLETSGDADVKARFERLIAAEGRNPLTAGQ